MAVEIFTKKFLSAVQSLVKRHHTIYPRLPPQGLFFEALVEQAFRQAGWSSDELIATAPNSPLHDISVGRVKLSIKSETGKATRPKKISITKLCTTEKGEWNARDLIAHTMAHVNRHDKILMMRTIWRERSFDYQLIEIPLKLLMLMKLAEFSKVGTRRGRSSIAADVIDRGEKVFRVHFDGADGKCQVHGLLVNRCRLLRTWKQPIDE